LAPKEIVNWGAEFRQAQEESFRSGKPLLIYFTAEWCGPCQQMRRTTWADPGVEQALRAYVTVKVDVDQNPQLAERFGATAIPAFTLMDKDGRTTKSTAGYMSAEEFIRWLKT
jgi:thiol:disulfide interchange protein